MCKYIGIVVDMGQLSYDEYVEVHKLLSSLAKGVDEECLDHYFINENYIGIDSDGDVIHYSCVSSFSDKPRLIVLQQLRNLCKPSEPTVKPAEELEWGDKLYIGELKFLVIKSSNSLIDHPFIEVVTEDGIRDVMCVDVFDGYGSPPSAEDICKNKLAEVLKELNDDKLNSIEWVDSVAEHIVENLGTFLEALGGYHKTNS